MRLLFLLVVLLASCCGIETNTPQPTQSVPPPAFSLNISLGKAYTRAETLARSNIPEGYKPELKRRLEFVLQRLLTADSAITQVQPTLAQSLVDKANKDMDTIEVWINERKTVSTNSNLRRLYSSRVAWNSLGDIGQCFSSVVGYLQGSCP